MEFKDAFKNKKEVDLDGLIVTYIGLQDFIRNKEASGRSQDINDIASLQKKGKSKKERSRISLSRNTFPIK